MALRDQPYIPLYIQDVLTDEKLIECSAESHGVYFRLMCILHKQEKYGLLCLKQKYKQTKSKYNNFAFMLCKQTPFEQKVIENALIELDEENVIQIDEHKLSQKRMVRDGELSIIRAECGKKGGSNVTKQYGKKGFLYLMSDYGELNKIGISVNPKNRLYRIRSDHNLKNFMIMDTISVNDMGKTEDLIINYFQDIIDGEWIKKPYKEVLEKFDLFKANLKAKPQANSENENESEDVIEIVNYLNSKVNSNYSYHARNIQQLVMDRLEEKFTVKDFKKVIDNKCRDWLNTKYAKFLRPETLFSVEHFDSYLNEKAEKVQSEITIV